MNSKLQCQQLKFNSCLITEGTSQIPLFRATVPPIFIERLRRLAQCSASETLKGFFLVRFSLTSKKNEQLNFTFINRRFQCDFNHIIKRLFTFLRRRFFAGE